MPTLIGQWFGALSGGSNGSALLYIERVGALLQGRVLIAEGEPRYGYSMFVTVTEDGVKSTAIATLDYFLNLQARRLEPIHEHVELAKKLELPPQVNISFMLSSDAKGLDAEWHTSLGNVGTARLDSFVAPPWSDKPKTIVSWADYRREVQKLDRTSWIFRGQAAPWSLRTCFHRRGRYDLIRYGMDDVNAIHRVFVSATNQWLQLSDPLQHASLLATAQHHGYPTPLLDWTRSPYIAAYFAMREPTPVGAAGGPRIHAFHASQWRQFGHQMRDISDPVPSLTILESVPFCNPRAVQQQSVTTITNVDNIERYINELKGAPPALRWFDFDVSEREEILEELEWMGVTESLLFPGMEGSFRTLARTRFPK